MNPKPAAKRSQLFRIPSPAILASLALLCVVARNGSVQAETPATTTPPAPIIAVTGTGWSEGMPSVIEINASLTGEGELTADALVKYRDARQRAVSALEALKIPGLTIDSQGYSIGQAMDPNAQQMAMRGMNPATSGGKVAVVEQLRLKITGAEKLEAGAVMDQVIRVLDVARDSGLVVGEPMTAYRYQTGNTNSGIAKFKIPDRAVIRDKAYEGALADARKKAEKLAELSGVKLGPIRSVREAGASDTSEGMRIISRIYGNGQPQNEDGGAGELSSDKFASITMKVVLSVEFDIAGK